MTERLDATGGASNAELIEAALAGGAAGQAAWNVLVERHARAVWKVLHCFALPAADREDLFQATWMRALERLHQVREPNSLAAWLMTIARHEAQAAWRRGRTVDVVELDEQRDAVSVPSLDSEHLEEAERRQVAAAAIARLPDQCRELVRLLTVDGLTYRDIEQIMGWPSGGVAIRRSRCIEQLRRTPEVLRYVRALARSERQERDAEPTRV